MSGSSQPFARKGGARPASALQFVHDHTDRDEDAESAAPTAPAAVATPAIGADDGELAEAASLQADGFKTTDQARDAIERAVTNVVPPSQPETAPVSVPARAGLMRPLLVGVAALALLTVGLAVGVVLDKATRDGPTEPVAGAPAAGTPAVVPTGFAVQLGSLPDRQGAEHLLRRIAEAHGDALADAQLTIQQVQIADRAYHRVRTGAFEDAASANDFCRMLQSRGVFCSVVEL